MQMRQGDVFIETCEDPDVSKAQMVKDEGGRLILAAGEATGHHHAVNAQHAVMYMLAGAMYLKVLRRTQLKHEEHAPIDIEPGWHKVTRQVEYTPTEIRRVAD